MDRSRSTVLGVVFCSAILLALLGSATGVRAQTKGSGKVLGIMPVFDASGEEYGELFGQNLAAMVFRKLQGAPFDVVLLNPGGLYNPLIPESIVEYAQSANVDTVLVMTFQQTDKPQKGDFTLHVEAKLMDAASGKIGDPTTYGFALPRRDIMEQIANSGLDIAGAASGTLRAGRNVYSQMGSGGNRPFEKQPLGKAANNIADGVRTFVLSQVPPSAAKAPEANLGTCTYTVQVKYTSKKAVSKAYDIILNGEEESLWTKEGVTTLENKPSGPVFIQLTVADAPYRLAVQHLYQANTMLDCSKPERGLFLDIGAGGDALLHWR